jgi:acyl-CoA thioesterase YciA
MKRAMPVFEHSGLPDEIPALRVVPLPSDVNQNGSVFGGWVMSQVDMAGGQTAMRRARGRVATVSVDAFVFKSPLAIGDIVSFYADIVSTGTTSIKVAVSVYAERNPENPVIIKVTEAVLTYVAIDREGRKRELPPGGSIPGRDLPGVYVQEKAFGGADRVFCKPPHFAVPSCASHRLRGPREES